MVKKPMKFTKFLYEQPFFRYVFVGGTTFAIDIIILFVLHEHLNVSLPVATTIAYWISIAYNFALNRSWTFSVAEKRDLHKHLFTYLAIIGFNYLFTVIFVSILGKHIYFGIAKVMAVAIQMLWTYPIYKKYVFTHKSEDSAS